MQLLIYLIRNHQQEGPYAGEQVQAMLDSGMVTPATLAWTEGQAEWAPLQTIWRRAELSTPTVAPPVAAGPSPSVSMGPRGVGGWLMVFCVGLTILGPIFSFAGMANAWRACEPAFALYPSIKTAVIWENFGSAIIVVYGLVVGATIWGGHPNGRAMAQTYLRVRLGGMLAVEFVALSLMANLPGDLVSAGFSGVFGMALREGGYFLIWWFYFKKSTRVRNTYG